ncbi:MAG: nucleotidyltransferase domain-containing protein [candidate division NC10 bacterium]|nr:nucleotidyltransferase domain-containing protein [candidate division NC10 bacterium]
MQPDPDVITQLVQSIVEAVHPLRIVLFGSAARGEMGTDSDIDVLVVMPEGVHRRRTAQLLYRIPFPKTHNLRTLLDLLPEDIIPLPEVQDKDYSAVKRSPDGV